MEIVTFLAYLVVALGVLVTLLYGKVANLRIEVDRLKARMDSPGLDRDSLFRR